MYQKPVKPDDEFAQRFAETSQYGFYLHGLPGDGDIVFIQLRLNPQSVMIREPFATAVQPMQGGGKFIESRGMIMKSGSISGTTGYLPPASKGTPHVVRSYGVRGPQTDDERRHQAAQSGFKAFYELRHLFRRYGYERRQGNLNVSMHYFDVKGDEYWRIEPQDFTMERRKAFTYNYSITFTCIEPSDISQIPDNLSFKSSDAIAMTEPQTLGLAQVQETMGMPPRNAALMQPYDRLQELANQATVLSQTLSGSMQRMVQGVQRDVRNVIGALEQIYESGMQVLETPLLLIKQLIVQIDATSDVLVKLSPFSTIEQVGQVVRETMAYLHELKSLSLSTFQTLHRAYVPNRDWGNYTNDAYTTPRGVLGAPDDYLAEEEGATGALSVDPALGANGLGLVTNYEALRSTPVKQVAIPQGSTIYSLAQQYLGDVQRFVDLVLLNGLESPYIVADIENRPSNTLAWGGYIRIPDQAGRFADDDLIGDAQVPSFSGEASRVALPVEVADEDHDGLPWRDNQWVGYTCTLTASGETRVVVANDGYVLTVNTPWTTSPVAGEAYTLRMVTFDPRMPVSPAARTYGVDLLLKFTVEQGVTRADIVRDGTGSLAQVSGSENLQQALRLRLLTEFGAHPFHPSYGSPIPVGRRYDDQLYAFYAYFGRQALLADDRIDSVRNIRLSLDGGALTFSADVQPINARGTQAIEVMVG